MGERVCFVIVLSVAYFIFWGYMTGIISKMFSDPKCIITDEDMEKMVQKEIYEHYPEIRKILENSNETSQNERACAWPPLLFEGRTPINKSMYEWQELERQFPFMDQGHFTPANCIPYQSVAILVFVYKDLESEKQFQIFINNVIPKLYRQQLQFSIYVVRQQAGDIANRGLLLNIGFKEALKDMEYDCVILHDVDVIPEDDRNYYDCGKYPRHMSSRIDVNDYSPLHKDWSGGIISMTTEQFTMINGWSNMYMGNFMENDDIYRRIVTHYDLVRTEDTYSFCGSTRTTKTEKKRNGCLMFEMTARTWSIDGLNSSQYAKLERKQNKLFILLEVAVDAQKVRKDYIDRTRAILNYDSLPNVTLTLNNFFCEELLGRKLNFNNRLLQ